VNKTKTGQKGLRTEELIRAYFIRAGFFVVRGVKLRIAEDDLTDIDAWLYERSATLARRRMVIDIKDRRVPQAAERLFVVKGLAESIGIEGAGVVTTDTRPSLRDLARKNGVLWIDGADLQRLKNSPDVLDTNRISEEQLAGEIQAVDTRRRSRILRDCLDNAKSAVADRFGASCANTALEATRTFAQEAVAAHPDSPAARLAGRLAFFTASLAAASIDFASAETALRPTPERVRHLTAAIRYGADAESTFAHLRWSEAAIREYVPNGTGIAQVVHDRFMSDFASVPAEGLAEIAARLSRTNALFCIARHLEGAAYSAYPPTFDELTAEAKGFFGAVLDFLEVGRSAFAKSWAPRKDEIVPVDTGQDDAIKSDASSGRVGSDVVDHKSDDRLL
jgi:hypothetical protein